MWYTFTMEYYSAIKRTKLCHSRDVGEPRERLFTQNEVSQTQKNKYCISTYIHGIEKNGIDELVCKPEIDTDVDNKHIGTKRVRGNGMDWETGVDVHTLMCMKQVTSENLGYSARSSLCSVATLQGRRSQEEGVYLYM